MSVNGLIFTVCVNWKVLYSFGVYGALVKLCDYEFLKIGYFHSCSLSTCEMK